MKSKKQHPTSDLHCGFCSKEFKYVSERKRHEQSHSPQFECKVCSKKFSFLSALRRHEKQHERTGNVVCSECNRKFRDESLLKRHVKYAHKGTFTCSKCEATFSSDLALKSHSKTHKPVSERKYHCSFHGCTKSFNFSHHLKHHELTHTNMKQHYCNVCGKGFIQSHHLKSHKKTHEPENWLVCGISGCKKTFSTEYARKKHIATHDKQIKIEDLSSKHNSPRDINDLISAENGCPRDIDGLVEPDTVKCTSCKQILLRQDYDEHVTNCVANSKLTLDRNTPDVEEKIERKLEPVKLDFSDDISGCKSFVGGCILGAAANGHDKCLCAQIAAALPSEDYYDLTEKEDSNNYELLNDSDTVRPNDSDNACEACDCACNFKSECVDVNTKRREPYNTEDSELDIVEYRRDGTIKIKESFDIDLEGSKKEDVDLVPYSCKAVLGNCIVSGNGTIGEGCLCARMAIDDQQLMTQEIEELTPCPKTD